MDSARRLAREGRNALASPFPNVIHAKAIILDLLMQFEALAAAVDRLENAAQPSGNKNGE